MLISRVSLDLILCEIVRRRLSEEAFDHIGESIGLRYTERAIREKVDADLAHFGYIVVIIRMSRLDLKVIWTY
jgi:hypothetical protein